MARQLADATRSNGDVDLPALLKAIGSTYESLVTKFGEGADATGALNVEQTDKGALVTAALDTVSEGIAVFDPEDRIVL